MKKLNGKISKQGYKRNSPDNTNDFNIIPSGRISMHNVPHMVYGIDNLGNEKIMVPGEEYQFPGNQVTEIPMNKKQLGGGNKYNASSNFALEPSYLKNTVKQQKERELPMTAKQKKEIDKQQRLAAIKRDPRNYHVSDYINHGIPEPGIEESMSPLDLIGIGEAKLAMKLINRVASTGEKMLPKVATKYNAIDYRKNPLSDKEKEMYQWFDEQMRFGKLPETTNKQSIEVLDNFKQRIKTPEGQKRLKELGVTEDSFLQDLKIVEDPNTYGYYRGAKNTIAMNPNHPLPKKVVRHEVEHAVQNALRQSKINKSINGTPNEKLKALESTTTEIDDILSGLSLRREGTPNKVWNKNITDDVVDINDYRSLVNNKQNATDYFLTGSDGAEKSAFLGEVQQYMMDTGKIPKDSYVKITPEMVKETMADAMFDEEGGGKYLRLFNIMKADPKNYDLISKGLNKMLTIGTPAAIGAATITSQPKKQKGGGYFNPTLDPAFLQNTVQNFNQQEAKLTPQQKAELEKQRKLEYLKAHPEKYNVGYYQQYKKSEPGLEESVSPLDFLGPAEIKAVGKLASKAVGKLAKAGEKVLPKITNTINQTYKVNPWAEKLNTSTNSYRVAGLDAAEDFKNTGILRSVTPEAPKGASLKERAMYRPTSFPSFQKGYADLNYLPDKGGVIFKTDLPTFKRGDINPVTGFPIKGRHYAHRVIDPKTGAAINDIPASNIEVYSSEPHWLKGFMGIPKELYGGGLPKAQLGRIEQNINSWLGEPMTKAEEASAGGKWFNPKTKQLEQEDDVDNLRHPMAARYTSEAIANKFPNWMQYSGIPQAAGFLGSAGLGVGHELSSNKYTAEDPRDYRNYTFWDAISEAGEDILNNTVGAGVGALPISADKKTSFLRYLSDNNMLPDGVANEKANMYFKPFGGQNTKTHTHMKDGGSLNRKVTCSNCGWSWKLVDGGTDPMTCHKCGGTIKMQNGGWLNDLPKAQIGRIVKAGLKGIKKLNPIRVADKVVPQVGGLLNPAVLMGVENMNAMSMSPLNWIPGYGKKLKGTDQAFRKFGNSIDDVIERQALSPKGRTNPLGGTSSFVDEGNWAAMKEPNEKYSGVFLANMNPEVKGSNIKLSGIKGREGVVGTTRNGNVDIPLNDEGLSFYRRLPFSNRYTTINKEKLIKKEFDLARTAPHLQSLAEKALGAAGVVAVHDYMQGDDKSDWFPQIKNQLDKSYNKVSKYVGPYLPKEEYGGWLDAMQNGGYKSEADYQAHLLDPYSAEKRAAQQSWLNQKKNNSLRSQMSKDNTSVKKPNILNPTELAYAQPYRKLSKEEQMPMYVDSAIANRQPDELRKTKKQGFGSKAHEVVMNPFTALTNLYQHGTLPDNFSQGETNALDFAVGAINPLTYLEAAYNTGKAAFDPETYKDLGKTVGLGVNALAGDQSPDEWKQAGLNTLFKGLDASMVKGAGNMVSKNAKRIINKNINKTSKNIKKGLEEQAGKYYQNAPGKMEGIGDIKDIKRSLMREDQYLKPSEYNSKAIPFSSYKPQAGGYTDVPQFNQELNNMMTTASFGKRPLGKSVKTNPATSKNALMEALDNARYEEGITDLLPVQYMKKAKIPYNAKKAFQNIQPNKYGGDLQEAQWGKIIKAGAKAISKPVVKVMKPVVKPVLKTLDKGLTHGVNAIRKVDEKVVIPIQFRKDIKKIKESAKKQHEYFQKPEVVEKLKSIGASPIAIRALQTPNQIDLTFKTGHGSYFDQLPGIINMDMREMKEASKRFAITPQQAYEHELGHQMQQYINIGSPEFQQAYAKYVKELEDYNIRKQISKRVEGTRTNLNPMAIRSKPDFLVNWNMPEAPKRLSKPTILDKQAAGMLRLKSKDTKTMTPEELNSLYYYHSEFPKKGISKIGYDIENGTERLPHLREMRQSMIDNGYIPDATSPITEDIIRRFIKENPKNRIASIVDPTFQTNYKKLVKTFKHLPAVLPIGLGTAAALQNEEYKRGGQKGLKKYTSKNIQSSVNDLFMRNETLFGPAGKKRYKPGLKYKSGGNWLDNLT